MATSSIYCILVGASILVMAGMWLSERRLKRHLSRQYRGQ